MTPHLQESTLVDTCLQYQISTTDFQVNLLCSSKETSIFEYVNLLSGKKPLTKFNQLILEAALHWTTLGECNRGNSLAAQRPTAPGWTASRRIHSIQRLTLHYYSARCGAAVSTIERGNWSRGNCICLWTLVWTLPQFATLI